jgi:hypothetical protein
LANFGWDFEIFGVLMQVLLDWWMGQRVCLDNWLVLGGGVEKKGLNKRSAP